MVRAPYLDPTDDETPSNLPTPHRLTAIATQLLLAVLSVYPTGRWDLALGAASPTTSS